MGFFSNRKEKQLMAERLQRADNIAAKFEGESFTILRRLPGGDVTSKNGRQLDVVGAGYDVSFEDVTKLRDYVLQKLIDDTLSFRSVEDLQDNLAKILAEDVFPVPLPPFNRYACPTLFAII